MSGGGLCKFLGSVELGLWCLKEPAKQLCNAVMNCLYWAIRDQMALCRISDLEMPAHDFPPAHLSQSPIILRIEIKEASSTLAHAITREAASEGDAPGLLR